MKIKLTLLALTPMLLLGACSRETNKEQSELTDTKDINTVLLSLESKSKEVKNFELTYKNDNETYDEDLLANVKRHTEYVFQMNEDNEVYMHSISKYDGEETSTISDFYLVRNDKYETVMYSSINYGDYQELSVLSQKNNPDLLTYAEIYVAIPKIYFEAFVNPSNIEDSLPVNTSTHDIETKYYSSGINNLTIKINYSLKRDAIILSNEVASTGTYTINYDKGYLKDVVVEATSSKGNKSKTEIGLTKKDKFRINLPDNWEDVIDKGE